MFQQTLKMIVLGAFLVFGACSKKATNASTSNDPQPKSENRPNNRPEGQRGERPSFDELMAKMDTNKDGKLSQSEVKGPLQNDFSKVDTNNDGFITADEFKNAPVRRPQRGKSN